MVVFYEKANNAVLQECKEFVELNKESVADYYIYCKALSYYGKLSQSLIDSHKDFEEAIKKETDKFIFLDDGPEKDFYTMRFNLANYSLVLDEVAHRILEQLAQIEKNNRTKKGNDTCSEKSSKSKDATNGETLGLKN